MGMIVYCEPKLNWETWQAKYRPDIRVGVVWDKLQKPKPYVCRKFVDTWVDKYCTVWYPWYGKKSWRDGKHQKVKEGKVEAIVVAPAVRVTGSGYLLLDCCHRISQLRPRFLILDYIDPHDKQLCYFNDLLKGVE